MTRAIPILMLVLTLALSAPAQSAAAITVAEGLIKVSGAGYEIDLSAANGGIVAIRDAASGQTVSAGDAGGSLWTASLDNNQQIGAGAYDGTFSYHVDGDQLTLSYTGGAALAVTVTVSASESAALTMQAAVSNHSGHVIDKFGFPSGLKLAAGAIQDALLPLMPGALIDSAFFAKSSSYSDQYPGVMFADYEAIRSSAGKLALYAQRGTDALVQPVYLGFAPATDAPSDSAITHDYKTWIADGAAWSSPTVAIRVGQDYPATIAAYRTDNGIDQYPSLAAKLGGQAAQYFAAPMYKLDVQVIGQTFASLKDSVIAKLHVPGIVHLVAFEKGGHDHNYPDFIPPDTRWGTTADFADLVSAIHSEGSLAVPYTNFSWWDTVMLSALPKGTTIKDIGVSDVSGLPDFETYGPRSGFVVDPSSAYVQSQIAAQHDDLLTQVGVDGIFEDQWGVRDAPYDFNPAAGHDPSTNYFAGVIGHFQRDADQHLMTEAGVDVLAQNAVAFMGTNYLWDMLGYRTTAAYTSYYPMAAMLLRDKVLLYQHDLAAQTWTNSKDMLRWNLAQGYGLSNAVINASSAVAMDNAWLNVIGVFQKYALAPYADQLAQSYDDLGSNVKRTTFATFTVYSNWDTTASYTVQNDTLPPGGVVTLANDGSVTAGVFTRYNGQPLSDGDHYLVEVRSADAIRVFQPLGADTTLHVTLPGWPQVTVTAYRYDGTAIDQVAATVSGSDAAFDYQGSLDGSQVGYYRLTPAA